MFLLMYIYIYKCIVYIDIICTTRYSNIYNEVKQTSKEKQLFGRSDN